ncbi:MAG: hypothetical protein KatS3mg112_0344 [Thermogutta sp.]|nr:MAG: hypothetical protein KatS3mg112_0344 [Thermogutta sp.]
MDWPYQNASELGWIIQGWQADVTSTSLRKRTRRAGPSEMEGHACRAR